MPEPTQTLIDGLPNSWRHWRSKDKRKLLDRLQEKARAQCSGASQSIDLDYLAYLRSTLPKHWTTDVPHIRLIGEHLDAVDRGEIDRLAIHMPPRHGKTETVTARYPVRCLMQWPEENVLLTAFNERIARRFGRKARNVAMQLEARGAIALDRRKASTDEWATSAGGVLMTRGVGSPPTGVGFRRIVIDDPIRRREDAESEVYREKLWDWYTDDLYTRLEPGGAIVLVMTLWHEDDLGARAVASEPGRWTVLKLAALAEEADPLGRAIGESLWPERYNVEALTRVRTVMQANEGDYAWNALYQQRPSAREGAFFKINNFQIVDAAPAGLVKCRAWDLAASAGKGDYTVGVLLGRAADGRFFVLDVVRGQWDSDDVRKQLLQTAALDGRDVRIHLPQDPAQAGKDQATQLVRMLAGYSVKAESVAGNKEIRAFGYSAQVNAANVKLVSAPWNVRFIDEHRQFPNAKNDDQVDGAADAFNEVSMARVMSAAAGGERTIETQHYRPR